jgi:hypothetical protein
MPNRGGYDEIRLWNRGFIIGPERLMTFHQELTQPGEIPCGERVRCCYRACGFSDHVPDPGHQWRGEAAADLGQVGGRELRQVFEVRPPLAAEAERLLAFVPPLVEGPAGKPMGDSRLHYP